MRPRHSHKAPSGQKLPQIEPGAVLRGGFELAGRQGTPLEAEDWLKQYAVLVSLLGEDMVALLIDREAEDYREQTFRCPYCGGAADHEEL